MVSLSVRSLKRIQHIASLLHSCDNQLHELTLALYTGDRAKTQASLAMADFQAQKVLKEIRKLDTAITKGELV